MGLTLGDARDAVAFDAGVGAEAVGCGCPDLTCTPRCLKTSALVGRPTAAAAPPLSDASTACICIPESAAADPDANAEVGLLEESVSRAWGRTVSSSLSSLL